jgi:hypothetical protein
MDAELGIINILPSFGARRTFELQTNMENDLEHDLSILANRMLLLGTIAVSVNHLP